MNISSYETVTESELLGKVFPFLVERGLENITIRELCKGTGLVQGSLYYWFGDKTTIVCEATEYGLKKVTDEMVGGHKKVISYFLRNGVASVTPFPVSAVLPRG